MGLVDPVVFLAEKMEANQSGFHFLKKGKNKILHKSKPKASKK
jgi:hypothetical protein